jgi:hypothetical protein
VFADEHLLITRGISVREAENFANIEMSKINAWSKRNKVGFNDGKFEPSQFQGRKRRKQKKLKFI